MAREEQAAEAARVAGAREEEAVEERDRWARGVQGKKRFVEFSVCLAS